MRVMKEAFSAYIFHMKTKKNMYMPSTTILVMSVVSLQGRSRLWTESNDQKLLRHALIIMTSGAGRECILIEIM
jgi:uncharacterized SAM-binding protein YcdF (DUF218 family)